MLVSNVPFGKRPYNRVLDIHEINEQMLVILVFHGSTYPLKYLQFIHIYLVLLSYFKPIKIISVIHEQRGKYTEQFVLLQSHGT